MVIELIGALCANPTIASTAINRWGAATRDLLFASLVYTQQPAAVVRLTTSILKVCNSRFEARILERLYANSSFAEFKASRATKNIITYRTAGGRYWKIVLDREPEDKSLSNKMASLEGMTGAQAAALIMSSTFWWYYSCHFDMYNLKDYMIFSFRFGNPSKQTLESLQQLGKELQASLLKNSTIQTIYSKTRGQVTSRKFVARHSKEILDAIDQVLAQHYGFSDEELDFIINYDIKYRMGADAAEEEE